MSNKRTDVAGFNDRYADTRNKGYKGSNGANIFPYDTSVSLVAVDPDGTYDSGDSILAGSQTFEVQIDVTEAFAGGVPTIIVGRNGDTDALVTLADNIDITTTGIKTVTREAPWPATAVARATIGGGPGAGRAVVTVNYSV